MRQPSCETYIQNVPRKMASCASKSSAFIGTLVTLSISFGLASVQGMPIPDNTLGPENSTISRQRNSDTEGPRIFEITEGAARGNRLFHSFQDFSIGLNTEVRFLPNSNIDTIFTRVTGPNRSTLNGSLSINGSADLFLINPNGILFGNQARLNLGGSFIATTASSVIFGEDFTFQIDNPTPVPPILTISTPTTLSFGKSPGAIENRSQALNSIGSGVNGLVGTAQETLAFLGGDLRFTSSRTSTQAGNIHLSSLAANSQVDLTERSQGWNFRYPEVTQYRDIIITQADIDTTVPVPELAEQDSSRLSIRGRNLQFSGASAMPFTLGGATTTGQGGRISLFATNLITMQNGFVTQLVDGGIGGDIQIKTPTLRLNSTLITTEAFSGTGGNIDIDADSVTLQGVEDTSLTRISTDATSQGQAGRLTLTTNILSVNSAQLDSGLTQGQFIPSQVGSAGDIDVQASLIILEDNAQITAATTGNAGNISLNASALVINDSSSITTSGTGRSSGGDINITTDILSALNVSDISTTAEQGDGGMVTINSDSVFFSRDSAIDVSSQSGADGTIELVTPNVNPVENSAATSEVTDIAGLIDISRCVPYHDGSAFYSTGRGGFPPSPLDPLWPDLSWEDWDTAADMGHLFNSISLADLPLEDSLIEDNRLDSNPGNINGLQQREGRPTNSSGIVSSESASSWPTETKGWLKTEDGQIVLISHPPTQTHQSIWLHPHDCRQLHEGLRTSASHTEQGLVSEGAMLN